MDRLRLASLLAITFVAPALHAQSTDLDDTLSNFRYRHFDIVTLSQPGVRHKCSEIIAEPSNLVCHGRFGRTQTFAKSDIAALIEPPRHDRRNEAILLIAVGGTLIASAFFIPALPLARLVTLPVAIAVGLIGGYITLQAGWPLFEGCGTADHNEEILHYQRADTNLTVALRH